VIFIGMWLCIWMGAVVVWMDVCMFGWMDVEKMC